MKYFALAFLILVLCAAGCAHRPPAPPVPLADTSPQPLVLLVAAEAAPETKNPPESGSPAGTESGGEEEELEEEAPPSIPDPLEPVNRAFFQFNDKLYFWVLKPVAQGYSKVVPKRARVSVKDFFYNLRFPIRFLSCLLQADIPCAGSELGRFTVNTVWGVGGLLDPASSAQLGIPKNQVDLGQTLGVYGLGHGFYIVWPVLGASSARDSIQIVGDYFLYPPHYITPWYQAFAVRAVSVVNDTSLRIGDYELLKQAAIDPYVALRDAYFQYRQGLVEKKRGKSEPPKPTGIKFE
jgi:phospholipid-binding lipoprotein MlaA